MNIFDIIFGICRTVKDDIAEENRDTPKQAGISRTAKNDTAAKKQDISEEKSPLDMTFSEAQRAGFQFAYTRRKSVIITSIHVKSDRIIVPAHIDGHPVEYIGENCRCLLSPDITGAELFLPDTVKRIRHGAFRVYDPLQKRDRWQPILTAVHFPTGRIYIENSAFSHQNKLKRLHFGSDTVISDSAFMYCTALEQVSFGEYVSMGDSCFYGCSKLEAAEWHKTGRCGSRVFAGTPFEAKHDIIITGNVLQKYNTDQAQVTIPDGVEEIAQHAFNMNKSIKRVIMPSSVRIIDSFAFNGCSALEHIDLENVIIIRDRAFNNCSALSNNIKLKKDVMLGGSPFIGTLLKEQCRAADGIVFNGVLFSARPNIIDGVWRLSGNIKEIVSGADDIRRRGYTAIIPPSAEKINLSPFRNAGRVIIQNPKAKIYASSDFFDVYSRPYKSFCVTFETDSGVSDIMMYFPKYAHGNPAYKAAVEFYNEVMYNSYGLDIYLYDSNILHMGLTYRQLVDIAYRRLSGGYKLAGQHRRMYEDFLRAHRKRALKYAAEIGGELESFIKNMLTNK